MEKFGFIGWSVPFWVEKVCLTANCPLRLASGTVSLLILRLVNLFEGLGLGKLWDAFLGVGNQAAAASVK